MELNSIIKKKFKFMLVLSLLLAILSFIILSFTNSYKVTANLFINDKYIKEMNDDAKYILSSLDYLNKFEKKSKYLSRIFKKTDEYSLSKAILVEKPSNDSVLKITFTSLDKEESIDFLKEYADFANFYLINFKNEYFSQITSNLSSQYDELKSKTDITQYRDALADSTISRLIYYKQIKEDKFQIVRLINYNVKPKFNKKLIALCFFVIGFLLPIVPDIIKKNINKI